MAGTGVRQRAPKRREQQPWTMIISIRGGPARPSTPCGSLLGARHRPRLGTHQHHLPVGSAVGLAVTLARAASATPHGRNGNRESGARGRSSGMNPSRPRLKHASVSRCRTVPIQLRFLACLPCQQAHGIEGHQHSGAGVGEDGRPQPGHADDGGDQEYRL